MLKSCKKILVGLAFAATANFVGAQIVNPSQVGPGGRPSTFTAGGVLVGQGAANVTATGAGILGQCLLSGGPGVAPAYGSCAAGANVSSVFGQTGAVPNLSGDATTTNSSVVTLKNTGTAGTYGTVTTDAQGRVLSATVITPVVNGGTGLASLGAGTVLIGNNASVIQGADPQATGTVLRSNGIAVKPTFQTLTSGSAVVSGDGAGGFSNVTIGTGLTFSAGTLSNSLASPIVKGHIYGFGLANNTTTPLTAIDIAGGFATNSAATGYITTVSTFTKNITGAWVGGNGAGMGTGLTATAFTWYHVFAITNNGGPDFYFDTSVTAANAPASTTATRYIGSIMLNGSSQIIAFKQIGQSFYWIVQPNDLNSGASTTPTLVTISAPLGFVTFPMLTWGCAGSVGTIWSPQSGSVLPTTTNCSSGVNSVGQSYATNTTSQVYYRVGASSSFSISTTGYVNPYVAPNL